MNGLIFLRDNNTPVFSATQSSPEIASYGIDESALPHVIKIMHDAGIRNIGIIANHAVSNIHALAGNHHDIKITCFTQQPHGFIDAIHDTRSFLGTERFVVFAGDTVFHSEVTSLLQQFETSTQNACFFVKENRAYSMTITALNDDGSIMQLAEHNRTYASTLAFVGIYLFDTTFWQIIDTLTPSSRGMREITDVIYALVDHKYSVYPYLLRISTDLNGHTGSGEADSSNNAFAIDTQPTNYLATTKQTHPLVINKPSEVIVQRNIIDTSQMVTHKIVGVTNTVSPLARRQQWVSKQLINSLSLVYQTMQQWIAMCLQLLTTYSSKLLSSFLGHDQHSPPTDSLATHGSIVSIPYLFSLLVGISTAIVYPLAWYRADTSERSDMVVLVAALGVIGIAYILISVFPNMFYLLSRQSITKIILFLLVIIYLGIGFREDNFYTDFLGFDTLVLLCVLVIIVSVNLLRREMATKIVHSIGMLLSIYVFIMGINAILIRPQSLGDTFFIFNEMVTPLTQLKPYSTFIPQYVNLFQYYVVLLDIFGATQYPSLTINLIYVFLQFISMITIGIACVLSYKYMYVRSLWIAVLVTLPMFFMTSRPFWDYIAIYQGYYVLPFFTYSLIPIRLFVVFGVGSTCLWLIHNANTSPKRMIIMSIICGGIASIGIYQSNDFGIFTWIGISVVLLLQPFIALTTRFLMWGIYLLGTVIMLIVLLLVTTDITSLQPTYLLWFQTQFANGFGGLPIGFPGNGFLMIICILVTWFSTFKLYTILQQQRDHYAQQPMISSHFSTLLFLATFAVVSLPYYTNHSAISFQGSTFYIFMCMSIFLLYQLLKRMNAYDFAAPPRITDITLRIFVFLPVAIALLYTPVYNRISQSFPLNNVIHFDQNDETNAPEYHELGAAGLREYFASLQPLQLNIAYVGSYANLVELYTNIPAASIFDHPGNVDISPSALDIYCKQMERSPYDLYFSNAAYSCSNMTVGVAKDMIYSFYYRPDFPQTNPEKWKQLREITGVCPIRNGAIVCPEPYIEMQGSRRLP